MRKKKNNIIEKTAVVFLFSFCAFVMLASFADAVIRPDHVTLLQYIFGILTVGIGVFVIYILGSCFLCVYNGNICGTDTAQSRFIPYYQSVHGHA